MHTTFNLRFHHYYTIIGKPKSPLSSRNLFFSKQYFLRKYGKKQIFSTPSAFYPFESDTPSKFRFFFHISMNGVFLVIFKIFVHIFLERSVLLIKVFHFNIKHSLNLETLHIECMNRPPTQRTNTGADNKSLSFSQFSDLFISPVM